MVFLSEADEQLLFFGPESVGVDNACEEVVTMIHKFLNLRVSMEREHRVTPEEIADARARGVLRGEGDDESTEDDCNRAMRRLWGPWGLATQMNEKWVRHVSRAPLYQWEEFADDRKQLYALWCDLWIALAVALANGRR